MRTLLTSLPVLLMAAFSAPQAESLSRERQIEIIENYRYVTGRTTRLPSPALEAAPSRLEAPPLKCGMSAAADFVLNRDKLDPDLLVALGVNLEVRPTYSDPRSYDSPSGLFKVHYTTSGLHAVYRANVDSDGDGVPDYVEDVAKILDSIYVYIIDTLGYPTPPVDGFYPSGEDDKHDVYLRNLFSGVFGLTYPDSLSIDGPGSLRATSFMELENDYKEMTGYANRPLDAVRVTCAHEFFHAVQFGIDFTEAEVDNQEVVRRYWMEMSAVWMEEEIYDEINDYYSYLPFFFSNPRLSIQQFESFGDLHPYGSVVFPIYLTERFGRDIIRDIWLRCGSMGWGASFLRAANLAIDSTSGGGEDWATAFREFAQWNYFTGKRASFAPNGVGYSEKEMYAAIPDTIIQRISDTLLDTIIVVVNHTEYPVTVYGNLNPYRPEHNSAAYLRLSNMRAVRSDSIGYDTVVWKCRRGSFPSCTDSVQVTVNIDTFFTMVIAVGDGAAGHLTPPQPWGLNVVYQSDTLSDSFIVEDRMLPYHTVWGLDIINPNQYRSVTMIVSPASYLQQAYQSPQYDFSLAYIANEILDSARIDTPIVNIVAAHLVPYPNPAVVADMGGSPFRFKFQILTESFSNFGSTDALFSVDIFNIAGEFVRSFDATVAPRLGVKEVEFVTEWDMKNEQGSEVASGVYIAVARLHSKAQKGQLLAEGRVKVAIIR